MGALGLEQLTESSDKWLHQALGNWWVERDLGLAMAGVSLEHLCKAALYRLHPTLIADLTKNPFESLLGVLELGYLKRQPGTATKTISASLAWDRLLQIHAFQCDTDSIKSLIDVRNGSLHAASLSGVVSRKMFTQFLRVTVELRSMIAGGLSQEDLLGDWNDLVQELLSEDRRRIESEVEQAFKDAAKTLAVALKGYDAATVPTRRLMLQNECRARLNLGSIPKGTSSDEIGYLINRLEDMTCPTDDCADRHAYALGWTHYREEEDLVYFHAYRFECGVCGLHFATPEHMTTANMSNFWALPGERPSWHKANIFDPRKWEA